MQLSDRCSWNLQAGRPWPADRHESVALPDRGLNLMEACATRWTWIRRFSWMFFAFVLLFCLTVIHPFIQRVMHQTKPRDFTQEWASARNYFTGMPIYENQGKTLFHYLGYVNPKGEDMLDLNAHPPASVLLCLPFAALDYSTAFLLWNLLSLAALVASIYLLA